MKFDVKVSETGLVIVAGLGFEIHLSMTEATELASDLRRVLVNPLPLSSNESTSPKQRTDVHTEHCCKWCGCKYQEEDCTVVTGVLKSSVGCTGDGGSCIRDW